MSVTTNQTTNVDVGRPKVGGYAFRAVPGTELPANATEALDAAFLNMGYVSNAGLRVSYDRTSTDHRDWNGDVVETTQDEYGETYTVEFIESLRGDLLKALFGEDNVTIVPPASGVEGTIAVAHNAAELDAGAWSFDMKSRRASKRIVIPLGKVTALGEVSFVANDLIRYSTTLKAYPDGAGNSSYEYKSIPALPGA